MPKIVLEKTKPKTTQWRHEKEHELAIRGLKNISTPSSHQQSTLSFAIVNPAPRPDKDDFIEYEGVVEARTDKAIFDELVNSAATFQEDDMSKSSLLLSTKEVFDSVIKLLDNKKANLLPRVHYDLSLLKQYTANLLKVPPYKMGKITASQLVARSNHLKTDGLILARRIRSLYTHYSKYRSLPVETRGGKRLGWSLLDDEAIFSACRAWLTSQPIGSVTPDLFRITVNQDLLPRLLSVLKKAILRRTSYRWLLRLGFTPKESKKGVYVDGHEREDVVEYRTKIFLPEIQGFDRLTV
jgi:hypothetical protein